MMKAKIGAIFLVSVMAFAALGAAYAHWEETLTINGVMTTDDIDPYFHCLESNDPPGETYHPDPDSCGVWLPAKWDGVYRNKDVGSCDIDFVYDADGVKNEDALKITISDAYPCYYAHPRYCISNSGSCPVLVHSYKLTELSFNWIDEAGKTIGVIWPVDVDLTTCTEYYVDIYWDGDSWEVKVDTRTTNPNLNPADYDYMLHPTGDIAIDVQLDPITWAVGDGHLPAGVGPKTILNGDLCIHFENGCREKATYDFTIGICFYNWPHYVGTPPYP